jgi:hypothetical protein
VTTPGSAARAARRISAIIIVGALVLVEVTVGITEAEAFEPVHAQLVVDHRRPVAAHLGGAGRMIDGRALSPSVVEQFVVALDRRPRQDLGAAVAGEHRCRKKGGG